MRSQGIPHLIKVTRTNPVADVAQATQGRFGAICSDVLFGQQRELLIEHAGSLYRLRITQNNKLILTK
jgi:hemin uptake protein HemP